MLISMTGHGAATSNDGATTVVVDVRAINSRYLKIIVRANEGYNALEPRVEELIRKAVRRGTIQVQLQVHRQSSSEDYRIDPQVLSGYQEQLSEMSIEVSPETLLGLPGVVSETLGNLNSDEVWEQIASTIGAAMDGLEAMRRKEGEHMEADLRTNCEAIVAELGAIGERAPVIAENYSERLLERIQKLLIQHGVDSDAANVVREVGVFAERADISEELVRLQSHLEQFDRFLATDQSNGKKLDFLVQEMYREANTIGSKANDVEIATRVVEIKTCIERMREMIQNIE